MSDQYLATEDALDQHTRNLQPRPSTKTESIIPSDINVSVQS